MLAKLVQLSRRKKIEGGEKFVTQSLELLFEIMIESCFLKQSSSKLSLNSSGSQTSESRALATVA